LQGGPLMHVIAAKAVAFAEALRPDFKTYAIQTIANAKTLPKEVLAEMKKHFIAGWGGYPIIGTPEQIVDELITMSKMGLDGTLLNWPRYIEDQRWFKNKVYPLVRQVREAARPAPASVAELAGAAPTPGDGR